MLSLADAAHLRADPERHTAPLGRPAATDLVINHLRSLSITGATSEDSAPAPVAAPALFQSTKPCTTDATGTSRRSSLQLPQLRLDVSCCFHGEWNSQAWTDTHSACSHTLPEQLKGLPQLSSNELVQHQELGRGFYGRVMLASWHGRSVAIKELLGTDSCSSWTSHPSVDDIQERCGSSSTSSSDGSVASMLSEASKLAELQHPDHVVALLGTVVEPGSCALVMEHMPSGSLRSALQHLFASGWDEQSCDSRLRFKTAVALAAAKGMQHVHCCGYVHLDLKLDNLLCDVRDPLCPVVKVSDVGLCERLQDGRVAGGTRGTLACMAPELFCTQGDGSTAESAVGVTTAADVYSFGTCLIEIWTMCSSPLIPPELSNAEVKASLLTGSFEPQVPMDMHPRWAALVHSCLQREPASRPSFACLAQQLQQLQQSTSSL